MHSAARPGPVSIDQAVLRGLSSTTRLVTIDHGPDTSADDKMRIVHVDPAGREEIISILEEYG